MIGEVGVFLGLTFYEGSRKPSPVLKVLIPYYNRKNGYDYKIKVVCRGLPTDKTKINCG